MPHNDTSQSDSKPQSERFAAADIRREAAKLRRAADVLDALAEQITGGGQ